MPGPRLPWRRLVRAALLTAAAVVGWFLLAGGSAQADELAPAAQSVVAVPTPGAPVPAASSAVKPVTAPARTVISAAKAAAAPAPAQVATVSAPVRSVPSVAASASAPVRRAVARTGGAVRASTEDVARTVAPLGTVSRAAQPLTSGVTSLVRTTAAVPSSTLTAARGTLKGATATLEAAPRVLSGPARAASPAAATSASALVSHDLSTARAPTGGLSQPTGKVGTDRHGPATDASVAGLAGSSWRVAAPAASGTPAALMCRAAVALTAGTLTAVLTSLPRSPALPFPFGAPGASEASGALTGPSGGLGGLAAVLAAALLVLLVRSRAAFPRSWDVPRSLAARPCFSPD